MSLSYPEVLEQQPWDKGNDAAVSSTLKHESPNIFVWGPHKLSQGPDILRNVIVSGYVTFYQINNFFVKKNFIVDKTSSRAVVWRPSALKHRSPVRWNIARAEGAVKMLREMETYEKQKNR